MLDPFVPLYLERFAVFDPVNLLTEGDELTLDYLLKMIISLARDLPIQVTFHFY